MVQFASVRNLKPARRYAKALIDMAIDHLSSDKIYTDIIFTNEIISKNLDLTNFLRNPAISKNDKKDVLTRIFSGKVDELILNFLFLLNENSRLEILEDICAAYREFYNEEKNILNPCITSSIELTDIQKENLKLKLQAKTGKTINPEFKLDKRIIGGLVIKINDTVIDLSLNKRIENLKKR